MSVWDDENREIDGARIALESPEGRDALYALLDTGVGQFKAQGIRSVLVTDAPAGRSGDPARATPDQAATNPRLRRCAPEICCRSPRCRADRLVIADLPNGYTVQRCGH